MQNTLKYEGVKGESQDLVRGWVDTATRVANKLNALEYAPQIELAMGEIDSSDPGGFAGSYTAILTVQPIPEPGAVWLFGSAIVWLVGVARRRKMAD